MPIRLFRPANGPTWLSEFTKSIEDAIARAGQPVITTVADAPDPARNTGRMIFVSNEAGGAVVAFSDGTNWRRVTDRAVIS
jgi:hypothetical protein